MSKQTGSVRETLADLLRNLTKPMSQQERTIYDQAYCHAVLDKTNARTLTIGPVPINVLISAIESALNAVQSELDKVKPQPVGLYWNPTIASLLKAIGALSGARSPKAVAVKSQQKAEVRPRKDTGTAPSPKTSSASVERPPAQAGTALDATPSTSAPDSEMQTNAPISYAHATQSVPEKKHALPSSPRSPGYHPGQPEPSVGTGPFAGLNVDAIRESLSDFLTTDRGPFIRHQKGHNVCKLPDCRFCRSLLRHVRITKCQGHESCHPSGWYPHVGRVLWRMIKSSHDQGKTYVSRPYPTLKAGEMRAIEEVRTGDSVQTKRRRLMSPDVSDAGSVHEDSTISDEQPVDWAEDVSTDMEGE